MTSQMNDDIAIIGISGYFPGAADWYEFWRNLSKGRVNEHSSLLLSPRTYAS